MSDKLKYTAVGSIMEGTTLRGFILWDYVARKLIEMPLCNKEFLDYVDNLKFAPNLINAGVGFKVSDLPRKGCPSQAVVMIAKDTDGSYLIYTRGQIMNVTMQELLKSAYKGELQLVNAAIITRGTPYVRLKQGRLYDYAYKTPDFPIFVVEVDCVLDCIPAKKTQFFYKLENARKAFDENVAEAMEIAAENNYLVSKTPYWDSNKSSNMSKGHFYGVHEQGRYCENHFDVYLYKAVFDDTINP